MFSDDRVEFAKQLTFALQAKNGDREVKKETIIFWFELFADYSIDAFKAALHRAVLDCSGRLDPAKVKQFLPCPLGHPTVEEAWNAAPKTEIESAYVTDEIMAAISAADDSIARGDMVAARMCFKEVYERNINQARIMNKPARFWLTEGIGLSEDEKQENRKKALTVAHAKGWISDNVYKTKIKSLPNFGGNVARLEDFSKGLEQRKLVASKQISKIKAMLNGANNEK